MPKETRERADERKLREIRLKEAEDLAVTLSEKLELPYTDLSIVPISIEALSIIKEPVARAGGLAIFQMGGNILDVAILTPNNEKLSGVLDSLKEKGYRIKLHICSEYSLQKAWERYKEISKAKKTIAGTIEVNEERLNNIVHDIKTIEHVKELVKTEISSNRLGNTSEALEVILAGALATSASDIHIEPEEDVIRLRLRLDGVLQSIAKLRMDVYKGLNSRIKLTSGLKLNVKKVAQDGRFSILAGGEEIEIRTSVMPGNYGESIVLRILNPNTVALDIELLGMDEKILSLMHEVITRPNGMLLNTGPTGSGKTTTLYSFLKKVNRPGIKIITIEDPIEYHLQGILQTQVRKGYSFLEGLRSGLRQDPDIIMVGEIRDTETAKIAVNSALTGHLVFSTLHTNNAAGTIPRLIDLGVNIKVLGDALDIAMAQRLLRKLCVECKKEYKPDQKELGLLFTGVKDIPEDYKKELPSGGVPTLWKADGCDKCNGTGYSGRSGIFEAISIDHKIIDIIAKNPNERELWAAARPQGYLRMKEHGTLKVFRGETDLKELTRIVDLKEE